MRRIFCEIALVLFLIGTSTGAGAVGRAEFVNLLQLESEQLSGLAAIAGSRFAGARIGMEFAAFAGSIDNADVLVGGLRRGAAVTLTVSGNVPREVNISIPTAPMHDADIYLSLALAKQRLTSEGIILPTPEQIKAALIGGELLHRTEYGHTVTRVSGVLTQRHRGMGWESIARENGDSLIAAVAGMHSVCRDLAIIAAHLSGAELRFSGVEQGDMDVLQP